MPNPVVHFEIIGRDAARLRQFYSDAFGWGVEVIPGGYGLFETAKHVHDESGATSYTGEDAYMNEGVLVGSAWGLPAWKYPGRPHWQAFEPGIGGGIGAGEARVSISIQVPDLRAALDRVVELGGCVVREIEEVAPSVIVASFADPERNVIGLVQG
jgi:hypothetical protein